jgi:DNA-binding transcriptional regulator GbsR (MarR family)
MIFTFTAIYAIYKTLDFFVKEINRTEERCRELERIKKRRMERKIKKRKKERKKKVEKELVKLEDIERYLNEFDNLFGEV